jgi:hypothetical protein
MWRILHLTSSFFSSQLAFQLDMLKQHLAASGFKTVYAIRLETHISIRKKTFSLPLAKNDGTVKPRCNRFTPYHKRLYSQTSLQQVYSLQQTMVQSNLVTTGLLLTTNDGTVKPRYNRFTPYQKRWYSQTSLQQVYSLPKTMVQSNLVTTGLLLTKNDGTVKPRCNRFTPYQKRWYIQTSLQQICLLSIVHNGAKRSNDL